MISGSNLHTDNLVSLLWLRNLLGKMPSGKSLDRVMHNRLSLLEASVASTRGGVAGRVRSY